MLQLKYIWLWLSKQTVEYEMLLSDLTEESKWMSVHCLLLVDALLKFPEYFVPGSKLWIGQLEGLF